MPEIKPLYLAIIGVFLLGLVGALGAAVINSSPKPEIAFIEKESPSEATPSLDTGQLLAVDIAGAVVRPGLYYLPGGSRVSDALQQAGSFSAQADWEWIHKSLNLATKLQDASKIYIPFRGELPIPEASLVAGVSTSADLENQASSRISINTASLDLLDSLPGIGKVRAQAIVDGRPYSKVEELLLNKVIPANIYENIKEQVVL